MLEPYRFEHPVTEAMQRITNSSYIAAAFLGPFYILYRKSGGFWPSLLLSIVLTLAILGFLALASFLPGFLQVIALTIAIAVALAIQSSFVIRRIVQHFRRRGWLIRPP
jgi:hypothetical protein